MRSAWRVVGLAPLLLVILGLARLGIATVAPDSTPDPHEASFDYFYVEANEGNSSGGHAAVRFGPWVYHFQNRDGLLVLLREPVDEFLYSYALLSNRAIHVSRVAVSGETWELIERNLERRRRAQTAQFEVFESLQRDYRLLEGWRNGEEQVWVPGLGYFRPRSAHAPSATPAAFAATDPATGITTIAWEAVRERIARAHGEAFLATRKEAMLAELDALYRDDPARWRADPPTSRYQLPAFSRAYSRCLADLAAGLAALEVLEQGRSLEPTAVRSPSGDEFRLQPSEERVLASYAEKLQQQLVALVVSERADWGEVFLIGAARLLALQLSLERGRWVGLDTFPAAGNTLAHGMLARRSDVTPMMLAETRGQFDDFRGYIAEQTDLTELEWERTEERFNRYDELRRGLAGGRDVRVAGGHLVPSRTREFLMPLAVDRGEGRPDIANALRRVRVRERAYDDQLDELYGYGLITDNCVSAIFETVNDSFPDSRDSAIRLGGWVDGVSSLAFIPFVSAVRVNERYRVVEQHTIDSYRQARLREARAREGGFWFELRESNTLTSTTYQRAESDSFFVFFTEDASLLRPLLGTVNLAAALGESVWGIAKLPFDRGATLGSGVKGAFMSLPELAFGNIRKGSNDWISPELREVSFEGADTGSPKCTPPAPTRSR